jgi:hypothetical protein
MVPTFSQAFETAHFRKSEILAGRAVLPLKIAHPESLWGLGFD